MLARLFSRSAPKTGRAETVKQGELWIGDRNFCVTSFLYDIAQQKAHFIMRLHGNLSVERIGRQRRVGTSSTGAVYEQAGRIRRGDEELHVRLVTVKLKRPTRDGDMEIVLVTNLPKKVSARRIAELYRGRWTIETALQQIAEALRGEIKTLAYPKAALFGFSIPLVAYNLLNVVKAAIATAHEGDPSDLSTYYLADEIRATYRGMMIVLKPEFWRGRYGHLSPAEMAAELLRLAEFVKWSHFRKRQSGPKKPPPDLGPKTNRNHVSTQRVLEACYDGSC